MSCGEGAKYFSLNFKLVIGKMQLVLYRLASNYMRTCAKRNLQTYRPGKQLLDHLMSASMSYE